MIHDNGTESNRAEWQKLLEQHNVEVLISTVYHPQTNRRCERFNRRLKVYMTTFLKMVNFTFGQAMLNHFLFIFNIQNNFH